jgi:hypothetical protein
MHSPTANSWVRIGSPNDPPDPYKVDEGDDVTIFTDSDGDWELYGTNRDGEGEKNTGISSTSVVKGDSEAKLTYRLIKKFTVELVSEAKGIFGEIRNSAGIKLGDERSEFSGRVVHTELLGEEIGDFIGKLFEEVIEFNCDVAIENLEGLYSHPPDGAWRYKAEEEDWINISSDSVKLGVGMYWFLRKGDKIKFVPSSDKGKKKACWHEIEGQLVVSNSDYIDEVQPLTTDEEGVQQVEDKDGKFWALSEKLEIPLDETDVGEIFYINFYREKTVTLQVVSDEDIFGINPETGSSTEAGTGTAGAKIGTLDGIRIKSSDNVWIEGENRYANYIIGGPDENDTRVPYEIKYLWDKFYANDRAFNPIGMDLYNYGDSVSNPVNEDDLGNIKILARKGQVKLAKGDTFNTQEGNIYDFGGYWNYNLGNSYEENHMDQAVGPGPKGDLDLPLLANLNNNDLPEDKADGGGPYYSEIKHLKDHGNNVWVTKNIAGASYDYSTHVDSVEVNHKCNTYEYKYGGRTEERKYTGGGDKVYEMESEGGYTVERKWCRHTGDYLSRSTSKQEPRFTRNTEAFFGGKSDFSSFASTTYSMSAYAGMSASMSAYAGMSASLSAHLGVSASLSLYEGASLSISLNRSVSLSLAISGAAKIDIDFFVGLKLDVKSNEIECNFPGVKIHYQAEVETTTSLTDVKKKLKEIRANGSLIEQIGAGVASFGSVFVINKNGYC